MCVWPARCLRRRRILSLRCDVVACRRPVLRDASCRARTPLCVVRVRLHRGYNIGQRLVDEFFAKSGVDKCRSFRDTADNIAKVAFRMFLGVTGEVDGWNEDYTACTITLKDNPLTEFVELPGHASDLHYSNIICGVIRGALEMVQMRVEATFVKDTLRGDATNEIRLELKELMEAEAGADYADD